MASPFTFLAEARIRDWQQRRESVDITEGKTVATAPSTDANDSPEGQLLRRVIDSIHEAARAAESERVHLERRSRELELQLVVMLESNGLPLAARRIAAELERMRACRTSKDV